MLELKSRKERIRKKEEKKKSNSLEDGPDAIILQYKKQKRVMLL